MQFYTHIIFVHGMIIGMKRAGLYIRTSTKYQAKGAESQERAIVEYCEKHEITDYILYKDAGISGAKSSRPALNRLIEDVKNYRINKVIVYSFSRFARSLKHLIDALELFKKHDVQFISLTENVQSDTIWGNTLLMIIFSISELERGLIRERVKSGIDNCRAKGIQLGRKRTCNEKLILELHSQKMSYRKIADFAGCSPSSVCRIIKRSKKDEP